MTNFRRYFLALALAGTVGLTVAGVENAAGADAAATLTGPQRNDVRVATKKYRDVDTAIAAGYLPTDVCVEAPGIGGMGYHYVHPTYASDGEIDISKPEVLVYQQHTNGKLRLGAVEYLKFDEDGNVSTDGDRPHLFDQYPFDGPMEGHEPGMPVHYDLHVWLYRHNPAGELTGFNPTVTC